MISFKVGAVLRITDGFTGNPVPMGTFRSDIDDRPVIPLSKGEGYFVFLNLEGGEHKIRISSAVYQDEEVTVDVTGKPAVQVVTLKPGKYYRYGTDARHYEIQAYTDSVWAAGDTDGMELKVAEDKAEKGKTEATIFASAAFSKHSYPDNFLIYDGKNSEIICVETVDDGVATFTSPLKNNHKRGVRLLPAQNFHVSDGSVCAVLRDVDKIQVFSKDGEKPVEYTSSNDSE